MIKLTGGELAAAAGGQVHAHGSDGYPARVVIDSREVGEGDLFIGLSGEHTDGGRFATEVLRGGAWGALVGPQWAEAATAEGDGGWLISAGDPLAALQAIAREWRRRLGARVVGITGSTGKTSVKDICRSILPGAVHASEANFNTEIGLPLSILAAPEGSEVLVLEMGMRGVGQIAELCAIAEPDVGAVINVGPAHLELLGSVEAVARTKAEILTGLTDDGCGVAPFGEPLLEPYLDDAPRLMTFGPGGDVRASKVERSAGRTRIEVATPAGDETFEFGFEAPYHVANALCAIAIGTALGCSPGEMASRSGQIAFSGLRGEIVDLRGAIRLVNDTYNANPISVRAALEHLAVEAEEGRAIAVLGGMAELGESSAVLHAEIGAYARELGVEPLIGVGELARAYEPDRWLADVETAAAELRGLLEYEDTVLVKGSRAIGLERLVELLAEELAP